MRKKLVTLALQGGGSHGAFTWGVLDRLLEDGRIDIEGISGASAGAMNAVVLAYGAQTDRHLGIPGELLAGSHAATEGDVASTRRPNGATMRSITWRTG